MNWNTADIIASEICTHDYQTGKSREGGRDEALQRIQGLQLFFKMGYEQKQSKTAHQ